MLSRHDITEIDLDNDQESGERGGTAADLQLAAEQRAMQTLYYQVAVHGAGKKGYALPSLQAYSDLPCEWPMARLCITNKQVNATPRTHCQAARGPSLLDVLWLVPPPSGGGTVRAIPLPLNPLWPHMVFHSRFFGMPSLKAVVFPCCHSFGSAYLTASHRVSHLASKCPTLNTMGHS